MLESQPSWAAWIEIDYVIKNKRQPTTSQPSWAAWIEISSDDFNASESGTVAALMGCVD